MNNLQFQQLSPVEISYPQFQSTPTYDCHPHSDKTSPSQLPQYFTFEETWRQPTPSNSPPGPFLLPSDEQCCPGVDIFPELDQIQLLPPPPHHYQYNSRSSEDDSSYQQFDNTPAMSAPLVTPFYLPDIDTNSLQFLTAQDDSLLGLDPIFFTQDISIPDPTPSSSPEPDMLSFIAENSALVAAREMFSDGLFNEVLDFISSSDQPERLHEEFQELWTETIYRQASAQRKGKVLNAGDRYRLRKRKPFPLTIWNGDQSRYLFKESSRSLLQEFFDKNPYPTPEEKRDLTRKSQLSYSQVSSFFKNRRGRQRGSGHMIPAKRKSAESSEDAKTILEMLQR